MYALIETINLSSFINSTNYIKGVEFFDTKLEADTEAERRNKLIENLIDKVLEDSIKKENETCLESYSTFMVFEIASKKEFDVSTRASFDIDENLEEFNNSFDNIVKEITKVNNE